MIKDPHLLGLGDSQLKTPMKIVKSVKILKRILENPHCVGLEALWDHQIKKLHS
jgi:hypothetical protein